MKTKKIFKFLNPVRSLKKGIKKIKKKIQKKKYSQVPNKIVTYDNGDMYDGENASGEKRHGFGIYTFMNGDVYEGEYVMNRKEGHGIYYFKNGDRYDGTFLRNMKHGEGIYYFCKSKKTVHGVWDYDKLIRKTKIIRE